MTHYVRLLVFCFLLGLSGLPAWAQRVNPGGPGAGGGTNAVGGPGPIPFTPAPEPHYTHVIDSLLQHVRKTEVPAGG